MNTRIKSGYNGARDKLRNDGNDKAVDSSEHNQFIIIGMSGFKVHDKV